ncbi:conserved hypothetical protein [Crocosphaera subtropica ATCC 51142]|uniref:peptidylprolyl isomerase n=1 Tax=Crocosphaera subtropica (strain ATCC 51142 / BH68) TaxID=43989 RepID=B1WT98_CROS5|nr:peptidylprolyl isomerase [Crocosphaera subtropica]ACB52020.1 conserved hypothetical protein [Crocosphaera subtropica ATCC 51142]
MEVDTIINFLKTTLKFKEIYCQIQYQRIINQAAEKMNLTVTAEEIQIEADSQRTQRSLEKAADTYAWLDEQMINSDDWEAGIYNSILRQKLAEALFSQEVEKYFAQNKVDFEQVLLYQIIVPYEKLAWEIFYQIEEEEMSFYQAAHIYDIDEQRRYHCGHEGKLYRFNLKPDFSANIFAAQPKKVITPLKTDQGYHILMVEEFIEAELTPILYEEIMDRMFQEWLAIELNYLLHNS